jgi:hypothetical protein
MEYMKNDYYKKANPEESLFNDNLVSLEELTEEELPVVENEAFQGMDREFSDKVLGSYFKEMYGSGRNLDLVKKFYGVGQDSKSRSNLAREYSLSPGRVQQIVSKPLCPGWKSTTIKILDSIKSKELDSLKKANLGRYDYSFISM